MTLRSDLHNTTLPRTIGDKLSIYDVVFRSLGGLSARIWDTGFRS